MKYTSKNFLIGQSENWSISIMNGKWQNDIIYLWLKQRLDLTSVVTDIIQKLLDYQEFNIHSTVDQSISSSSLLSADHQRRSPLPQSSQSKTSCSFVTIQQGKRQFSNDDDDDSDDDDDDDDDDNNNNNDKHRHQQENRKRFCPENNDESEIIA